MDWLLRILGALGGFVGTGLGVYNFLHARRQEQRARATEEQDWQMFVALRADLLAENGNAFVPDFGSDEHRWAERMVTKGLLKRSAGGAYYVLAGGT
jgi:hypothetical protein